jgi:hypothetical protein
MSDNISIDAETRRLLRQHFIDDAPEGSLPDNIEVIFDVAVHRAEYAINHLANSAELFENGNDRTVAIALTMKIAKVLTDTTLMALQDVIRKEAIMSMGKDKVDEILAASDARRKARREGAE